MKLGNFSEIPVTPTVFIIYESREMPSAHQLFMELMLFGCTARMVQSDVADTEKRREMIENALRSVNLVVQLQSAQEPSELVTEQRLIAEKLAKPLLLLSVPVSTATIFEHLQVPVPAPTPDLPAASHDSGDWLVGSWRLKFFHPAALAHGFGSIKLTREGRAEGTMSLAQGVTSLNLGFAGTWSRNDAQITIDGAQQLQGLPNRLPYKLEMHAELFCGEDEVQAFSVSTPQGDRGVLQRTPEPTSA